MKQEIEKYILEPMLLTSIMVSLISILWFQEKQYIMAGLLFCNGISSYIYHYDNTDRFLYYDIFFSVSSFICSLMLARRLLVKNLYELLMIVLVPESTRVKLCTPTYLSIFIYFKSHVSI